MPDVTFTIPTAQVPRVRDAFDATFSRQDGETDLVFFKRVITSYVKKVVVHHEGQVAGSAAKSAAEATATSEVSVT